MQTDAVGSVRTVFVDFRKAFDYVHARIQGGGGGTRRTPPLIFGMEKIFTARRYASAVYAVVECLSV